jgi:uncharacterized membrane protein
MIPRAGARPIRLARQPPQHHRGGRVSHGQVDVGEQQLAGIDHEVEARLAEEMFVPALRQGGQMHQGTRVRADQPAPVPEGVGPIPGVLGRCAHRGALRSGILDPDHLLRVGEIAAARLVARRDRNNNSISLAGGATLVGPTPITCAQELRAKQPTTTATLIFITVLLRSCEPSAADDAAAKELSPPVRSNSLANNYRHFTRLAGKSRFFYCVFRTSQLLIFAVIAAGDPNRSAIAGLAGPPLRRAASSFRVECAATPWTRPDSRSGFPEPDDRDTAG